MEFITNNSIIEITQDERIQLFALANKLSVIPSREPELFCIQSALWIHIPRGQ